MDRGRTPGSQALAWAPEALAPTSQRPLVLQRSWAEGRCGVAVHLLLAASRLLWRTVVAVTAIAAAAAVVALGSPLQAVAVPLAAR